MPRFAYDAWRGALALQVAGVSAILPLDWNRDFKMDLAVAGRGGIRLFTQQANGSFTDATAKTGQRDQRRLPSACGPPTSRWTAISILIAGVRGAAPVVLRNNGDGTCAAAEAIHRRRRACAGSRGAISTATAIPTRRCSASVATCICSRTVRAASSARWRAPAGLGTTVALTIGDANGDGVLDLVTLESAGAMRRFSRKGDAWDAQTLATWPDRIDAGGGRRAIACSSPTWTTTAPSTWSCRARVARASGSRVTPTISRAPRSAWSGGRLQPWPT